MATDNFEVGLLSDLVDAIETLQDLFQDSFQYLGEFDRQRVMNYLSSRYGDWIHEV